MSGGLWGFGVYPKIHAKGLPLPGAMRQLSDRFLEDYLITNGKYTFTPV